MLQHPVFASLTPEQRQELVQKSHLLTLKRGDVLIEFGRSYANYFFVASGAFRLMTFGSAGKVICGFETADGILGDVTKSPTYTASFRAEAALESQAFAVPVVELAKVLFKHPKVSLALVLYLGEQLLKSRRQMAHRSHASPELLVGKSIYAMSRKVGGTRVLDKKITQTILAESAGMSREQVNKSMKELQYRGLLKKEQRGYVIDDAFAPSDFWAAFAASDQPEPEPNGGLNIPLDLTSGGKLAA